VQAHDFRQWDRKQAVGIIVAHILFRNKRHLGDVVNRENFFRQQPQFLHLLAVKGHLTVSASHLLNQPGGLQFPHRFAF
jgi:hypothetical protein